jgi:hypothetical protein
MQMTQIRVSRRVGLALSFLLVPFLLSGCFKFTMDLEVSDQDTISGDVVVALSKELQALAQDSGGGETTDAFSGLSDVEVTEFDDGTFVGQKYSFSGLPIEELSLDDDASALSIKRIGDNLVVSGTLSFEDDTADPAQADDLGFGQAFFDSADLRVAIKFPGEIRETNGSVDEETNTITWIPKYGEANEISAVVYSPRGVPIWVWWALGGVGGVLVVAALVVLLVRRSSRASRAEVESLGSVADSGSAQNTGERPVFSYRVVSKFFPRETFDLKLFNDRLDYVFLRADGSHEGEHGSIRLVHITDAAVLEGKAGLGARVTHSGGVTLIPARVSDARVLVGTIQSLITASDSGAPGRAPSVKAQRVVEAATPAPAGSLEDDLRALKRLLDDGVVTSAEFAELKKKRIEKE